STLITSAPMSPRYWAQSGPASTLERSRTFSPDKGWFDISGCGVVSREGSEMKRLLVEEPCDRFFVVVGLEADSVGRGFKVQDGTKFALEAAIKNAFGDSDTGG